MRVRTRVRWLLRRNWRRTLAWREKLAWSEEAVHLALASGVGVIGALVNLFFHHAIEFSKLLVLQSRGDPVEVAERLGYALRFAIPAAGGLVAGLVLYWGLKLVGPQGTTNLLEVVVAGDGRLPFRSGVVKVLSSLVSIGTGSSIGREGGITQLCTTVASKWGQLSGWQPYRLRLLVGCGAAAGISAAYNAPISGAVFAATIVVGNFSMNLFAPLVLASVVASVMSRSFFGIEPWFAKLPDVNFTHLVQLPWFVVLGLVAGLAGALLLKLLRWSAGLFRRIPVPLYGKLALGGMIVGLIAIAVPEVWGNGYVVTNRILREEFLGEHAPLLFLCGLLLAKLLATAAAVGSGTVGGLFTPTLFLGAALGSIFGTLLHLLGQAEGLPTTAFALVGMASVLAATTHSPLLAMIMVFEISLDYSLVPALMLGCAVSIVVARKLHGESVYTEPLRLKGLEVARESGQPGVATARTVGELMRLPVSPVRETAKLNEVADRFLSSPNNFLPVVNEHQQLVGLLALQDMKPYLNEDADLGVIAHDLMRPLPACVTPNQSLVEALPVVLASEQRHIPVVSSLTEKRLVGSLVRAEVLGLLSEAISPGGKTDEAPRLV